MYPLIRTLFHLQKAKTQPKLDHPFQENVLTLRAWPWDIDPFMELNNGRYLTLMDIGRFSSGVRIGLFKILKENNWSLMVGAVSIRYRYRLRPFQKFSLHTRLVYFDDRWFYFHQAFKTKDKMHASALVRTAVTSKKGLVPAKDLASKFNISQEVIQSYNQPHDWILNWEKSDDVHKVIMENGELI